ncbi:MAG TPA: signal peptidase II [Actinomycetota bacterium]
MQEGRGAPVGRSGRARALLLAAAGLTLAIDQASKALVLARLGPDGHIRLAGDVFAIVVRRNPGGAFGMFPDAPLFFFVATVAIVVGAMVWGWRTPQLAVPVGMIVGGGLGNLLDRLARGPHLFRGQVVDFIYLSFWPTFNLADSAIVVGVALLLLTTSRVAREESAG